MGAVGDSEGETVGALVGALVGDSVEMVGVLVEKVGTCVGE